MGCMVDNLSLCVSVACLVGWAFLDDVVGNRQNIVAVAVECSNFV